ncbi:MAG: DUF4097 family beta strand repeat-containing protein [Rhodoglobus sp.]|nr:DUF4097 family beta strand repeat-containing protein [Rhodoglobus sp.]
MAQEKWMIDGPKTIDIEMIRKLKVGLIAGQVNVVGHNEPTTRVEVHSVVGRELKITVDGDTLEIDHPQLRWDNFVEVFSSWRGGTARADISIQVPRDVALKFGVISASGLITGLTEDASVSTVSGDLVIDNVYGDLQLNAVNGEIAVRSHYGSINAHTVSGDITASGEIMRFTADTVSGDVFLDITGVPDEIRVNTISGSVTTRLAADVAAQYRINTVSGRLQLDNSEIRGIRGAYTGKFGNLEKRWLDFKANTVSGDISVLHAVSA